MSDGSCKYWDRFAKKLEQTDPELFRLLVDTDDAEPYLMYYDMWSNMGMGDWSGILTKMGWSNREIKFDYNHSAYNSGLYSHAEFNILWIKMMESYRSNRDEFRNKLILGLI